MGRFTTSRVIAIGGFVFLLTAPRMSAQQKPEWTWKDQGNTKTRADLDSILRKHRRWIDSKGKLGTLADFTFADLTGARLNSVYLDGANILYANLTHSDLRNVHMVGTVLDTTNLTSANLTSGDLRNASLAGVGLHEAKLLSTNLSGANLNGADISGANLSGANLASAQLARSNMDGARLSDTDMAGAQLSHSDLARAIFEPKSLPELRGMASAKNLELVTYDDSPTAMVQLRKQFQDAGFREHERKITYALMRRQTQLSWEACWSRKTGDKARAILWSSDSNLANCSSFILNRMFFDWTCQYGMSPGRPLSLGALVWAFCSILYFVSIRASGEAGLYRVYAQSIHDNPSGQKLAEKISPPAITQTSGVRRLLQFFTREWAVLRASMFFSLMSAFNIGFRDINFGRWLRLLTRQEFDIKAVGWARVVAGWQSLISVYFIALWVLTYFGRPFG